LTPGRQYNILIVEDEKEIAEIIRSYLQLYKGFQNIVIAEEGVQAMQKISNQEFDLIITDIVMERRDGLTFIDALRRLPKYFNQKIVVVSGCLTADITLSLLRKNVRHIIVKPFTARQLLTKVVMALGISRRPDEFVDAIIQHTAQKLDSDNKTIGDEYPEEFSEDKAKD